MKKIILLINLSLVSFALQAQSTKELPANRQHEFRLDALEAVASANIEISYEYILNKYSGVGASLTIGLDNEDFANLRFAFTPFYRQYFFNKKDFGARGFFVEGFAQYSVFESLGNTFNTSDNEDTFSAFGLGFAVGQKWVSKNGFIFEISLGIGRRFGGDVPDADEIFARGGFSIGYRLF